MNRKWLGKWISIFGLVGVSFWLLNLSSCARSQKLVGIHVLPGTVTFGGVGAEIKFKAIGTYIHPPENKDVTSQAQWSIDSQNLVTFNAPGDVTAISDCGTGNVMASIQEGGNDVFGTAFVAAAGVGTTACTQAVLTVTVAGSGTVTSAPTGINCPSAACVAPFPLDSTVGLSATPGTGATTVTWSWPSGAAGCSATTATTCSVTLNTNQAITATFQ